MKVLVTGGAGYIGSTTALALEQAGHTPIILDSLVAGPRQFAEGRVFYEGDVGDRALLRRIVDEHPDIGCTIHMAALMLVNESVEKPFLYYRDNVAKSLELFDELERLGKPRVLFSSSGSIYAMPETGFEVTEDAPIAPTSPYSRTKAMMEQVLVDLAAAGSLRAMILRYFNPIGADPGLHSGIYVRESTHIVPRLVLTAQGVLPEFAITGVDYPTRDGTGIRDYIHVWDVARAHVAAVEQFDSALARVGATSLVLNVGTGNGVTVRELVESFQRVYGQQLNVVDHPRRPGDAVGAYANVDRIAEVLGWRAELTIDEAIASALAWGRKRKEILGYD